MNFKSILNSFKRFSSLFLNLAVAALVSASSFATSEHLYYVLDEKISFYIPLQQKYALNTHVGDKVFEKIGTEFVELHVEEVSCEHISMYDGCIKTFQLRKSDAPLWERTTVSVHISYWEKLQYDLVCALPYAGAALFAYGTYKFGTQVAIPGLAKVMTTIAPYFKKPFGY